MFSTDQKGAIAETAIVHQAVKLGRRVWKPVVEGSRADLIIEDLGARLLRVQCKWANRHGDVVIVRCYSCRRGPAGQVRKTYSPEEVDAFAAYCAEVDRCYLLPLSTFGSCSAIHLRLGPTRNNQRRGIHWAEEYELAATLESQSGP